MRRKPPVRQIRYTCPSGLELIVGYRYYPGTSDTRWEPGTPPEVSVVQLLLADGSPYTVDAAHFAELAQDLEGDETFCEAVGKVEEGR